MTDCRVADATLVRARLAEAALGTSTTPLMLGTISLRAHQRGAAGRLRHAILKFGGALLADDVGLGKTYTALAAIAGLGRLLIVGPASLAPMWRQALHATSMHAAFLSFETLSRSAKNRGPRGGGGYTPAATHDVVIVDEAHHARNPATRRYAGLAALTAGSRVLLLTATPVHNAADDLHALLALFLGSRAGSTAPRDLAACIVRRTHADVPLTSTPARAPPIWVEARADPKMLETLLRIPPACPPRDGGVANGLVTLGLVRAWSSTDAALRAALRRRVAHAESLADAIAAGRHPTALELRAWAVGDDATQLAFPELVTQEAGRVDTVELLDRVTAHAAGVRTALQRLSASEDRADDSRRGLLRRIRANHSGQSVVVFSQYAESVRTMFTRLVQDGGVCGVTAHGAMVAGGRLPRAEALARFAPRALGLRPPSRADVITMLITTDLLSEGLNLQDAAVVVHLDLPWTPARLAQRMGRVWRLGSLHTDVFEYAISPPPPAERVAAVMARLQRKAVVARAATGVELLPLLGPEQSMSRADLDGRFEAKPSSDPHDVPRASERIHELLVQWLEQAPHVRQREDGIPADGNGPCATVAAVRASFDGWLAAIDIDGHPCLVARRVGHDATTDPTHLLEMMRAAGGQRCPIPPSMVRQAAADVDEFLAHTRAATVAGLSTGTSAAHARVSSRIAGVVAASPPHRRPTISRLAANARNAISRIAGAGVERALTRLVADTKGASSATDDAEDWLARVARLGQSTSTARAADENAAPVVAAILLLVADA